MTLFFTSDTHFGDHRTINIHRRPFPSAATMDRALVEAWNATVSAQDEIWHLGDFARTAGHAEEVLPRLNGRKHLVRGNNDPEGIGRLSGWASVQDYAELEAGERLLVLCHYPFRSWSGQRRKSLNLHGHSHGRLKPMTRQMMSGWTPGTFAPFRSIG